MKLLASISMVLLLSAAACKKDKPADTGAGAGSGSAAMAAGSGSAATAAGGSGSAATGSGSATPATGSGSATAAGSGSATAAGSGSAMAAGSGSAMAAGSGSGSGDHDEADDPTNYPHHDDDFDKLSHEDRHKFMKEHVTVDMKVAFQKFDPKHYAEFGCKTCHGKDPKAVHFHMPNPELPKLDFEALKAGKQKPEVAKFMEEVVEPQMAKLLGAQPFDMKTGKGFGCLDCHEQKK